MKKNKYKGRYGYVILGNRKEDHNGRTERYADKTGVGIDKDIKIPDTAVIIGQVLSGKVNSLSDRI